MKELEKIDLVNLTGHNLNLLDENNKEYLMIPSDGIIRLEEKIEPAGSVAERLNGSSVTVNVPLTKKSYGGTELPSKKEGVLYIVSLAVAQYAKDLWRNDFVVPSDIQRTEDRKIILWCRSLGIV